MTGGSRLQVCAVVFLVLASLSCAFGWECRPEDFIGEYTACVNGHKNLIYYKNRLVDCTGTLNQPSNVYDIPCDISCPSGQYLPLGSTSPSACTPCNPGSYSLGGGMRLEGSGWKNNSRGWAAVSNSQINFRTSCTNARTGQPLPSTECSKWLIVDGSLAYSGTTPDNGLSVLEASATFVRDGQIAFEYRVDAERGFDTFNFEMDDTILVGRVSQQLSYLKVTFQVPAGVHVFRWKYSKDFSLRYGEDAVVLRMIEVTGTAFADSECARCSRGYYALGMGNQQCSPCPANTAAPNEGTSTCAACRTNEFSYVGAVTCTPSLPCAQTDVMSYYSSCHANNTRSKYYYYQTPKICSEFLAGAYVKPADQYDAACAQCSPGWYRNPATHICEGCPTNTFSPGNGEPCRPCDAGKVGRRDFIWTNFEELPNPAVPASMGCTGDCGTNGWRLGAGFIDSGVGHGAYNDVFFTLNLTVVSPSTVTFDVSFLCDHLCVVSYTDFDVTGSNATDPHLMQTHSAYSFLFTRERVYPQIVPILPGDHQLTFHFSKFDGSLASINDRVRIHGIKVMSVSASQGGAAECQECIAGQYADSSVPYCQVTPPGTYSGPLATSPIPCPVNTFAEFASSTTCLPCGEGTTAPRGASWCDESCKFRLNSEVSYDLKPLSRPGGDLYGPIIDPVSRRNFYLNVCSRDHSNSTCLDDDNNPIRTQACLTEMWGFGLDIGRVTNFYPHPTDPEMGLKVVYRNSTADAMWPCRARVNGIYTTIPRSTTITFNCDPMAGFGTPEYVQGSNVCAFNFAWNSLFACPACDESDWNYYYTECVNGTQFKTFKWKDNPRRCHGGKPLPTPIPRECSSDTQIPCPAGTYLLEECTACEPGTYSLGGSRIFNWWPYGSAFDTSVFAASQPNFVTPQNSFLEFRIPVSSSSTDASLTAMFNWVTTGSIKFVISAITGNGYTLKLATEYDPADVYKVIETSTEATTVELSVAPGTHTFTFSFHKELGVRNEHEGWLRIYNITTFGTSRAASQCTQALPGTIAPYTDRLPSMCPINTIQPQSGKTSCETIDQNQWAPAGSERSYGLFPCAWPDYEVTPVSECSLDFKQDVTISLRPGVRCTVPLSPNHRIPCRCAPGMYRDNNGQCRTCASGTGWSTETGTCVRPTAGYAAIGVYSLVKGRLALPSRRNEEGLKKINLLERGAEATWSTSCTGTCVRAWSLGVSEADGPVLDSGRQVGWSSSTLTMKLPLDHAGQLTVTYRRQAGANIRFLIFVDGTIVHQNVEARSEFKTFSFDLKAGERTIAFAVFAQEEVVSDATVRMTQLEVSGAMIGGVLLQKCPAGTFSSDGASGCTPCGAGYYSEAGSSRCQACEDGKYTHASGSATCRTCPPGTETNEQLGHSLCIPSCRYQATNGPTLDWRDLRTTTATVAPENRRLGWPDVVVDLCHPVLGGCSTAQGNEAAFGCAIRSGPPQLNFATRFASMQYITATQSVELNYDSGESCSSGQQRSMKITMQCPGHSSASQSAPQLSFYSNCHAEFSWYTTAACRACTQGDYRKVYGECSKRTQSINYVLESTDCHHTEFTQPAPSTRPCSSVGVSLGLLVGVGLVLVLLVSSLIIFCMRHRRLSTEYHLLKAAHDGSFVDHETQFGVDDDEEGVSLDRLDVEEDDDDGLRLPTAQTSDE